MNHASSRNSWGRMWRSWALEQQLLPRGPARMGALGAEFPDGAAPAVDCHSRGHVSQTTADGACGHRKEMRFGGAFTEY